jgi:hypothetical protein
MTVTSSVREGTYYYNRRYHSFPRDIYPLPDDNHETQAMGHDLWYVTLNGNHELDQNLHKDAPLFLAPKESIQDVLDIGTGTGLWATDYGTNGYLVTAFY